MHHLIGLARRLLRSREATAAVEFALILPVMLTLYVGSIELSQAISVDQRVTTVAGTVGDLVARKKNTIAATSLTDYFQAAQAIISPYPTTGLKQVITLMSVASDGKTKVVWSIPFNGGQAQVAGQPYTGAHPPPDAILSIVEGKDAPYIVMSEASYPYLPLLGLFFKQPFQLYHQNFYLPRYGAKICYDQPSPC